MRSSIALAFAALVLAGCGSSEKKTVVVTPPGSSTTVVTPNGDTHVEEPPP